MAIAEQTPPLASVAQVKRPSWIAANWGLLLATAALIGVLLLPTPDGLAAGGPSHARHPGVRGHRLDDRSARLRGVSASSSPP